MDVNISGSDTSEGDMGDDSNRKQKTLKASGAVTEDIVRGNPFFAGEDENETPEEKRLRMTKKLINDLGEETKNNDDFFMNL